MKVYMRLRVAKTAKGGRSYSLGLPLEIGRPLEESGAVDFILELTEDGILFRPTASSTRETTELPEWMNVNGSDEPESDESDEPESEA